MAIGNFTTIKISNETKSELDKIKSNQESYNNLLNRLIDENKKLNNILGNVEELYYHLQDKKTKK